MKPLQKVLIPSGLSDRKNSVADRSGRYGICRVFGWLCLLLLLTVGREPLCPALEYPSLQPLGEEISDFDARLQLARLLSYDDQRIDEALKEYRRLQKERPDDLTLELELAEVLMRGRHFEEAVAELEHLMRSRTDDNRHIAVTLARAYTGGGNDKAALALLEPLYQEDPKHKDSGRILAQIYRHLNRTQDAVTIMSGLIKTFPGDIDLLVEMADLQASVGHVGSCRRYFVDALNVAQNPDTIRLAYAARMSTWGDFYNAELIYKEHLLTHPSDMEIRRKLAGVLVSAQRYEEAESFYRLLLLDGYPRRVVLRDLAKLHAEAKNNQTALGIINEILDIESNSRDVSVDYRADDLMQVLRLKAQVLARMGQWDHAVRLEKQRVSLPGEHIDALLALGRIYLKKSDNSTAAMWFDQAYRLAPEAIPVRFYYMGLKQVGSDDFLNQLLKTESRGPLDLVQWGQLYSENGCYARAIACYHEALVIDPECFPARLALAETLAYDRRYDDSINAFKALAEDFPGNRKIFVAWARVLSWARLYDEALNVYEQIQRHNPDDPLPKMEMARTAAWAKKMDQAMKFYGMLWQPPVDRRLAQALTFLPRLELSKVAQKLIDETRRFSEKDSIYQGYEYFAEQLFVIEKDIPVPTAYHMQKIAAELWGVYRIQKIARLESRAKWLAWNRRFPGALAAYEELIETRAGNKEAIFDKAQVQCALGLCDREADTYRELLRLEPLHTLADRALQRQQIRSRPSVATGFNLWSESGRGDLSRITRYRYDVSVEVPLACRYHLLIKGHRWKEDPKSGRQTYTADGYSLGFNGVLSSHVTATAEWTRKDYSEQFLDQTDTGLVNLWYRLDNGTKIGLGYERIDELYNDFGILQGTQSSSGWAAVETPITRRWDLQGRARSKRYNDDNEGTQYTISTGYAVTDHPRLFKVTLSGDYRDTQKENIFMYENGRLVDIIHPYWTPTNHGSGAILLEWYHDLAADFFCGARQHYYHLSLTLGTETKSNHFVGLQGEWQYEFHPRWTLHLNGLIHRSREWDAGGLWAQIQYRF